MSEQVRDDPYTVSRRTPLESANGLYAAVLNTMAAGKSRLADLESQLGTTE